MAIAAPVRPASLLRRALAADAAISGAAGALQLAAAGPLSSLLALDAGLLRGSGAFLLLWTGLLVWLLSRQAIGAGQAWAVIGLNLLWAAGSVALWLEGAVAPNALGLAYLLAQAAAVVVFAELQFFGLRRQQRGAV